MGILIIGVTSIVALVWVLAFSMATESTSEKRRASGAGEASLDKEHTQAYKAA